MKSTILIKLFKSLEIHCTLYKCKTIGFLVNITEILQNNLDIFGEAVESSPQNHFDSSCLKLQVRALIVDCSCGSFSRVMFKAFLGPSNPAIQCLCQTFSRIFGSINQTSH